MKYCIGDTIFSIDIEEKYLHKNFQAFLCDQNLPEDMHMIIAEQQNVDLSDAIKVTVGQMDLVWSENFSVVEGASGFDILYPKNKHLSSVRVEKDYHLVQIYAVPDKKGEWIDELNLALKDVIYLGLEVNGRFIISSSSILHKGRAIFFAVDPEQKLVNLCEQKGLGTCLNEERNVIGIYQERIYAYGTPWSGEKNFATKRVPMGGIVFIKKSNEGNLIEISVDRRQMLMLIRCRSPFWREGLLDMFLTPMQRIEPVIWIRQLQAPIDEKAVEMLQEALEKQFGK